MSASMTRPSAPLPYAIHFEDSQLVDLTERLARVRWPDEPPGDDWRTGTQLDYLRALVAYWRNGYDFRRQEALLNGFPQFKVRLSGIDLHFIHAQGKGPAPMPLLLLHGW